MIRKRPTAQVPPSPRFTIPVGAEVIAIGVDGYLGVTTSTTSLFDNTISPGPDLDPTELQSLADGLFETGTRHFVLSGWSPSRLELAGELAERGARVDAVWHGNYLQTREDYGWAMFQGVIAAARAGTITKVGVVKAGMDTWLRGLGVSSGLLLNFVPDIPDGPSVTRPGGPYLGLWLAAEGYRKLPYAMIAAVGMIEGATLAGSGVSERALEFARFVGLDTTALLTGAPLDRADLMIAMGRTHLNLYVTQSECGPMLPFESLATGVPCLIGPNSHVFADDDYLASTLIVPYPDHAEVIARFARNAIAKRSEIVEAYRDYAPGYIARARQSVELFLA